MSKQNSMPVASLPKPAGNIWEPPDRLPLASLFALATVAFVTILTEALPAALLPQIARSLQISEALTGQTVSIYAIGSFVAAIPITAKTQGLRRRPLLLIAMFGFVLANTVMAFSSTFILTMVARFLAGMSAGLVWALLAGYAARMAPKEQQGRAIAIAMVGTPLALSLGVPLGAFLATVLGWRTCFALISLLTVGLMMWIRLQVPDFSGHTAEKRQSLHTVLMMPGVRSVLFQVLAFVLAHNILYTYIGPFLSKAGLVAHTDVILLLFGLTALLAIVLTGVLIERWLHVLTLACIFLFCVATLLLGFSGANPIVVCLGVATWGLGFGGAASLFQTALVRRAGEASDVAQSMLVTTWNVAIASGGVAGGLLLKQLGVDSFAPAVGMLLIAACVAAWRN